MSPRALRGAAAAACLAALAGLSAVAVVRGASGQGIRMSAYAPIGERLIHGLRDRPEDVSYRMPMASIFSALVQYHAGMPPSVLLALQQLLLFVLVFSLGCLLHPYGAFFATAAVLILMRDGRFDLSPESGYRLLFLLTACLLAWRARAPSPGKTFLLALAVGATLLYRTPLAFFPPVLALYEWAAYHRSSPRAYGRQLAILCIVPYLVLLPWAAMNWTVHGRLILFEKDAATANVVTGALGLVRSVEGDLETLVGGTVDLSRPGEVAGWAAREVLGHPLRYARACARRAAFAFSLYPLLFVLAGLSLYYFRERREYRSLGLLAGYFFAIHCLMSVEDVYFEPLEPLLAVLACALVVGFRKKSPPAEDSSEYRFSVFAVGGVLGLAAALGLYSSWVVGAFAFKAREGRGDAARDLDAAVAGNPEDPWLLRRRGRLRLAAGELSGAEEDLRRAAFISPGDGLRLAWAEALGGDSGPLLRWRPPPRAGADDPLQLRLDAEILKACALIREGRTGRAEARLRAALELHSARNILVRGPHGEREREVLEKLRSSETGFRRHSAALQGNRPESEKRALDELLDRVLAAPKPGRS